MRLHTAGRAGAGRLGLLTLVVLLQVGGLTLLGSPAQAAVRVFPIPSSDADPGRIVTAPGGDMWFTERDTDKVGRITPSGHITEYALPATTAGDVEGSVMDLDVDPHGDVWVVYDYGRYVAVLDPQGRLQETGDLGGDLGGDPNGGEIRIAHDGTVWITMNYAESGIARVSGGRITWNANAPECDDVLGLAADRTAWCAKEDRLIHVDPAGDGGTTYPMPDLPGAGAPWPLSLAAGPAGSIWFGAYDSSTFYTAAGDGVVGYLDQRNGHVTAWSTGLNTAPSSLVEGPDKSVWFTTVNEFHPGIGHLDAHGRGAISAVGSLHPTALTFAEDGSIWFTDAQDNSIGHVQTSQLQRTTASIGRGATFHRIGGSTAPVAVVRPGRTLRVAGHAVGVTLRCGQKKGTCAGTLALRTTARHPALLGKHPYRIEHGRQARIAVALSPASLRRLRPGHTTAVRVQLTPKGRKRATYTHRIKVRR